MANEQGKATGIPAVIKAEHDTTWPGSKWKQFFEDAEILPEDITTYCKIFAEKRITRKRLGQLTEDHLEKMGIKVLGDRLGIMDQAKKVCAEISKETSSHSMSYQSEAEEKVDLMPFDPRTESAGRQPLVSRQVASASAGETIREEATNQRGRRSPEISQGMGGRRDGRDGSGSSSERNGSPSRGNTKVQGNTVGDGGTVAGKISGGVHHGNRKTYNRGSKSFEIKDTKGSVYANDGGVNNNYGGKKRRRH